MPTTPYMGLILPTVSTTIGPTWATNLNTALTAVDSHTHAPGLGLQVPVAGININADLSFSSFNATTLRTVRFNTQTAPLALPADAGCVYQVNGDLYYNNGSGTAIKITSGTSINATAVGGIGGDYVTSGASVFYTSASKLFSFQAVPSPPASLIWAALGLGPITIYDTAAAVTKGITLKSPAALAAAYSVTLPAALPGSTLPVQMDATGATTLAQITTAQITPLNVTRATMAAVGQQISTSSGAFGTTSTTYVDVTNLTVTITTTGRPVMLFLQHDGSVNTGSVSVAGSGATTQQAASLLLIRGVTNISETQLNLAGTAAGAGSLATFPVLSLLDTPAAGTYTYKIQGKCLFASNTLAVSYVKLVAYEL